MIAGGIRVRFAPSPSGHLHVGNARTALFNWMFARQRGGVFLLRIEDTDRIRATDAFEADLLDDLTWLGLDWDEGPRMGGAYGPYRQSERLDRYRDCLLRLIDEDRVYPCYCTEEELDAERADLIARRMMPRYMGKCRRLTEAQRRRLADAGRLPVWRFRVDEGEIPFVDLIRGNMVFQGGAIGDFIIVRSSGIPSYHFAVVVDDHHMKISHVIRGEDHLSNTASQMILYRALGFTPPVFAHHSLILGQDRAKLSKRHGAVSVREFRSRGILPEVLLNSLALLGSPMGSGREVLSTGEIIDGFSLERTGRGGAVFDMERLLGLNGVHIRHLAPAELTDRLIPFIRAAGYDESVFGRERLEQIVTAVQDGLPTLTAIGDQLALFCDEAYRVDEEAATLLKGGAAKEVLSELLRVLEEEGASGGGVAAGATADRAGRPESFAALVKGIGERTGIGGKKLYLPIRAAMTGRLHGPELDRVFPLLGPASLRRRVERALTLS
ncbi:MAG: glutamate--tRNA ligase [Thermodesulfobacteriota bacterium]